MLAKLKPYLLPALLVTVALIATLYNIKGFPMMVGDEGIYVSQAWWLVHFGKLGPYTYWYDHFPLGWTQIGLWQLLSGGPFTFGLSVFSGRVFMAILKAFSIFFFYRILEKLTHSKWLSVIGSLIFIFSPLALAFNRQVLLDNIATFWLIVSLYFLLVRRINGLNSALSSLSLALGILSKESLLFLVPAYLYGHFLLSKSHKNQKYLVLISLITLVFTLSFFPLLALLKKEFLPSPHVVSLLETIVFQTQRGNGLPFWQENSDFRKILSIWLKIDPILIISGFSSIMLNLLLNWKNKLARITTLFSLFFSLFLMRGGLVYDFYLIPLIPLLVLNQITLLSYLISLTKNSILLLSLAAIFPLIFLYQSLYAFKTSATQHQIASTEKMLEFIKAKDAVVSDNYNYLDLTLNNEGNVIHPSVFWYSKAETDESIKNNLLNNDPSKIDYFIVNDTLSRKLNGGELPFLQLAQNNLQILKKFGEPSPPTSKPYGNEAVILYGRPPLAYSETPKTPQEHFDQKFIVYFDGYELSDEIKSALQNSKPWGVLVGFQNVRNTAQLEQFMTDLRAVVSPDTRLLVHQSDSGRVSIPWIGTALRNSYKSPLEASQAVSEKSQALKKLGFDGNIVTNASNHDGFLEAILNSSEEAGMLPILEADSPADLAESNPFLTIINEDYAATQLNNETKGNFAIYLTKSITEDISQLEKIGVDKFVINLDDFTSIRAK